MSKVAAWPENYKFAFGQSTQLTNGLSGKTNWRGSEDDFQPLYPFVEMDWSALRSLCSIVVSINIGTNAKPVGLTCWSANPAAQQRRPTTKCTNVVVICYIVVMAARFNISTVGYASGQSGGGPPHSPRRCAQHDDSCNPRSVLDCASPLAICQSAKCPHEFLCAYVNMNCYKSVAEFRPPKCVSGFRFIEPVSTSRHTCRSSFSRRTRLWLRFGFRRV